ncbi:MAG: TMEM165/GDT1 family protein [Candidatus Bathyarchaeia archaeon]
MDLTPIFTAFSFILLAELGDKTQMATIALSLRSSPRHVFLGSMLAFFVVDGMSALLGGTLLSFLPSDLVSLCSGIVFIAIGILSILRKDGDVKFEKGEVGFLKAFSLVTLMELGDKTQLASIILAVELGSPLLVLIGVMLAFSIVTATGIVFGTKLLRRIPEAYIKIGASAFFIIFGAFFVFHAIT